MNLKSELMFKQRFLLKSNASYINAFYFAENFSKINLFKKQKKTKRFQK
jgi:hypothetical protein